MPSTFEGGSKLQKVLGIDPGTHRLGYAVVESISNNTYSLHTMGVLRLNGKWDLNRRFFHIYREVGRLLTNHNPDVIVVESPFYQHNVQTSLKLGRVIGMMMSLAYSHSIAYMELSPAEVKKRITGNGRASKRTLEQFLAPQFGKFSVYLSDQPDAVDALGIAYAYLSGPSLPLRQGGSSWQSFLRDHPDRIR